MKIKNLSKKGFILAFALFIMNTEWCFSQKKFTINTTKTYQTIRGFGASDAWSNTYMLHWSDSIRTQAADWLFSNSPPVHYTNNGKAFTEECNLSNLHVETYDAFSGFLIKSAQHFQSKGMPVKYISPVNEPEWSWCQKDGQEGAPYKNDEIAQLVDNLSTKLKENEMNTQIQIPESGLLVFANPGNFKFKPGRQNEINYFFNKNKKTYIGDNSHVAQQICAHSYFTEWPVFIMKKVRKRLARTTQRNNLEYWMTEYCILLSNKEIQGGGRDLGMHTALYVARVIHHDLVHGKASSWNWWLGISPYDYKDGLVYAERDGSKIYDSKLMWALGNYSQFIKNGSEQIQVKGNKGKKFYLSAFKNEKDKEIVLVAVNMKDKAMDLKIKGLPEGEIKIYETSDLHNIKKINTFQNTNTLSVNPKSVTTFVIHYN